MNLLNEESNSSSEIDSDLEDSLYSQIHYEWAPNQQLTPNTNFVAVRENSIFQNINRYGRPSTDLSLTQTPFLTPVAKQELKNDIITLDSSGECEIVEESSISKYNRINKKNTRKRKILEEEIISSDNDSGCKSIYVHLDGIGSTEDADKLIGVDSDLESISPIKRVNKRSTPTNSSNFIERELEACGEKNLHGLSVKELLDRNMNKYFNSFTENHSGLTSQEVIKKCGKHVEWFITVEDRKRLIGGKSKRRGVFCDNCHERGHIKRFCKASIKKIHCYLCGGNHFGDRCDKRTCPFCWRQRHFNNICPEKKKYSEMQCTLCKCLGHSSPYCADLWRKYHLTIKEGPIVASSTSLKPVNDRFCSNCAQRGHFVHECKKNLMDKHMFVHRPDIVSYSGLLATPDPQILANTTSPSTQHVASNSIKKSPKKRNKFLTHMKDKIRNEVTQLQNFFIKPKKNKDLSEKKLKEKIKKKKLKKKLAKKGNKKSWKVNEHVTTENINYGYKTIIHCCAIPSGIFRGMFLFKLNEEPFVN